MTGVPPKGPYPPPPYYGLSPPGPYPPLPPGHPAPPVHQPPPYYVPGAVVLPYPMYPSPHPHPPTDQPSQPPTGAPTYVTNHYYNTPPEASALPSTDNIATEVKVEQENRMFGIEWIPATSTTSRYLEGRAVVAGHEGWDGSPLWVIRAAQNGDLIPGKLSVRHNSAFVPYDGKEISVQNIEVLVAPPNTVRWVPSGNGMVPHGAIPGGNTSTGEPLYIGRARYQLSLTPGKIHQSHQTCYISFGGNEISHKMYDVLCRV